MTRSYDTLYKYICIDDLQVINAYTIMCYIDTHIGIIIIDIIYDVLIMMAVHNKLPGNSVACVCVNLQRLTPL